MLERRGSDPDNAPDLSDFSSVICSRRRRLVEAFYPANDGNDDDDYRSERAYSGENAGTALGGTQKNEQEENAPCCGVDAIDAVKEAPNLRKKAPSPSLCSIHRAISRTMIGCGRRLGKELSAEHASRISEGDWNSDSVDRFMSKRRNKFRKAQRAPVPRGEEIRQGPDRSPAQCRHRGSLPQEIAGPH
jgi:hypothetical protein